MSSGTKERHAKYTVHLAKIKPLRHHINSTDPGCGPGTTESRKAFHGFGMMDGAGMGLVY